jgi:ComF family protein
MNIRFAAACVSRLWNHTIEFVLPESCVRCGSQTDNSGVYSDRNAAPFCSGCRDILAPEILHSCRRCGAVTGPWSNTADGCVHCRRRTLTFDSVVCMGMYEGALRQFMLSSKWSYSAVNMQSLANLLWHEKRNAFQALQIDRIIPIPQHWQQRLVRHFNPAWIIAESLSRQLAAGGTSAPCDASILRRCRRIRPQKRSSVLDRFANQRDSFEVCSLKAVQNQKLLLVDDVLTTGATCSEAARILMAAGAAECHVAVIGRVLSQPSPAITMIPLNTQNGRTHV